MKYVVPILALIGLGTLVATGALSDAIDFLKSLIDAGKTVGDAF